MEGSLIVVHGAQQAADFLRLRDGGKMLRLPGCQGLCQAACRVGGHNAGQAGIARYLSAYLGDAPRRFNMPGLLYLWSTARKSGAPSSAMGRAPSLGKARTSSRRRTPEAWRGVHLPICFAYHSRATFSKVCAAAATSIFAALRSALGSTPRASSSFAAMAHVRASLSETKG